MFNVILFDLSHFRQKVDGFHIYKEKPSQNVSKRAKKVKTDIMRVYYLCLT